MITIEEQIVKLSELIDDIKECAVVDNGIQRKGMKTELYLSDADDFTEILKSLEKYRCLTKRLSIRNSNLGKGTGGSRD